MFHSMSKYSKKDIFINIEAVSKQTWHLKIILFEIKKTIRCMFNPHNMLYDINVNVFTLRFIRKLECSQRFFVWWCTVCTFSSIGLLCCVIHNCVGQNNCWRDCGLIVDAIFTYLFVLCKAAAERHVTKTVHLTS